MLVAYFDEVKYQKGRSPFYWLGAIVAGPELIWKLEGELSDLAAEVFGTRALTRQTEFHAAAIMGGNEHFKGWPLERRIDLLKKLMDIFGSAEGLAKIFVKMDVEKMVSSDVEGMAFMFLVERVDGYLQAQKLNGLLIGDRESEAVAGLFAESLSKYRAEGTKFAYGIELKRLLDQCTSRTRITAACFSSRTCTLGCDSSWKRAIRASGIGNKSWSTW